MRKGGAPISVYLAFLLIGAGLIVFFLMKEPRTDKYRETQMLMGTVIHIDVCPGVQDTEKGKLAYKAAWERLEDIAWRMNVLDERSDVSKINHSDLDPVLIGADTYKVLKQSMYYYKITKGAFDITVWPLISLWQRSEKNNRFPTEDEIQNAQKMIGMDNIRLLADNLVRRLNPETQIDLGGVAKGYAVDEVARIFREHEISNFFIDAGGDVYVGGTNCSGNLWRIGIRDPRDPSKIIDIVELTDSAVATSGNYEKFYTIKNEQLSHIIDPSSGYPQKDVVSATVIAPSAIEADALATALCILSVESGIQLMDTRTKNHASLIVVKDRSDQIKKFPNKSYARFSRGIDALHEDPRSVH